MRDRIIERIHKRANVVRCEKEGLIADSADVRKALIAKVRSGESTPEEMQAELRKIQRDAKKNGKLTRNQAFIRG